VSPRTFQDENKLGWEGKDYRLACQSQVLGDVSVITNPRKVAGWMNHPTYERGQSILPKLRMRAFERAW
jgi:uncharacterized 2Fe-2S/4Fe-4S cluster protein (DUF4445 family)